MAIGKTGRGWWPGGHDFREHAVLRDLILELLIDFAQADTVLPR
jgi:hypothetical protein